MGPYEITARLGAGGMGEVFRARDDRIGRDVAIKVLPASFAADADRLQRFEQEARSAGTLNHPNLVTIYDIGRDNGAPYIVMELLDGETLRERFSSPRADRRKTLLAIADVANAIGAAHHAGVIHRDLKPENIIVTASGYTKVLDFGLAKFEVKATADTATQVRKTEPGVVMGTAGYMSPEQAQGRPADQRSDIFALGCILYEALTGKRAFEGKSTIETLNNIINSEPTPVRTIDPRLPPEMQRIVRKCLAKDPDNRYQSAKDIAIDLRDVVGQLDSSPEIAVVQQKRNWTLEVVAGLLLAAIAAAIGWYAATHRHAPPIAELTVRPLTTSGDVIENAISPDGKYIAYVTSRSGQHTLWLRQIGASQPIRLASPERSSFWGHTFSPDGTSIYYGLRGSDAGGALFQIPTLGGQPRKLLTNIDSTVSFSPDGNEFVFTRASFPQRGNSALIIAKVDGSGERTFAVKRVPEAFAPIFFGGAAWSPDGKTIVAAVDETSGTEHARLSAFDVATGRETRLTNVAWGKAAKAIWMPDGKSLVVIANAVRSLQSHVWKVEYPSGDAHPLTSGVADYRDPAVTADGRTLSAVAANTINNMFLYPKTLTGTPRRIGTTKNDGTYGVAFAPDGAIVYTNDTPNGLQLWTCDPAGACQQIVTTADVNRDPSVLADGRIIFYGESSRGPGIWRVNRDGSDLAMIAPASTFSIPFLSPDAKTVYFNADFGEGEQHLYRVPVDGGKPEMAVRSTSMGNSTISNDGKRVAGFAVVNGRYQFAVVELATGTVQKSFELRGSSFTRFHWSADPNTIYYNATSQLYALDLTTGKPRTLLQFDAPDLVSTFAVATDGTFVVVHGPYTRDAYLLTGF